MRVAVIETASLVAREFALTRVIHTGMPVVVSGCWQGIAPELARRGAREEQASGEPIS